MLTKLLNDLRKAARLGPAQWRDLARACFELALSNRRLTSIAASELLANWREAEPTIAPSDACDEDRQLIGRVAFAVPLMGARVPWRSDCLVQAMAAQSWLAGAGVAATICIGARKNEGSAFEAHAWLKVGDEVVTGGDISSYAPLLGPEPVDAIFKPH